VHAADLAAGHADGAQSMTQALQPTIDEEAVGAVDLGKVLEPGNEELLRLALRERRPVSQYFPQNMWPRSIRNLGEATAEMIRNVPPRSRAAAARPRSRA
jgi:hypothetical protein